MTGTKLPANLCGLAGAWFADAGFWFFGRSVWWVPAALIVFGLVSLKNALVLAAESAFCAGDRYLRFHPSFVSFKRP